MMSGNGSNLIFFNDKNKDQTCRILATSLRPITYHFCLTPHLPSKWRSYVYHPYKEVGVQFTKVILKKKYFIFLSLTIQKQLLEQFYKKAVLKNLAIFIGKHLCWSLFLVKMKAFREEHLRTTASDHSNLGYIKIIGSYIFGSFPFIFHCAKGVRIRSYSGPDFSAFGLNTERYFLRIQSKCGKMRTRITLNTDTFHAGFIIYSYQQQYQLL